MLSTRDYKSILDLIHLIYEIDDRAVMFKALCDALPKLVPIKSAAFAPFSTGTSELEFPGALMYNLQPYPLCLFAQYYAARQPYLIAIASRDPRSYLNKATNITDVVPSARLKHTEYGTDFQPIAGVLYEACITVAAQGDRLGIMGLHRAPGDRDFTSREQRILNVLLPHLARSFQLLGLTRGRFANTDYGELVFNNDGTPLTMNKEAERMLSGMPPSRIPFLHDDSRPTFFSTSTGIYRVRMVAHHPRHNERTVYLSPWPARHIIEAKLSGSRLTKRQQEIALLAIQGHANRDIADRLFISEQTVKDHLHDIFDSLKIKRRTQLTFTVLRHGTDADS